MTENTGKIYQGRVFSWRCDATYAFLVLDLGLDVLDGVGWLDLQGDGLAGEGLDENLHDNY